MDDLEGLERPFLRMRIRRSSESGISFPCPAHSVLVVYSIGHVWRLVSWIGQQLTRRIPMQGPVDCALKTLREEGLLKF